MEKSSPLVSIEKIEYHYHNHVDTEPIIHRLDRIFRAVKFDTSAEEALAAQNEDLRKQLQDILSGENLPPEVQKKIDAIFSASEAAKANLEKGISDNQPPS